MPSQFLPNWTPGRRKLLLALLVSIAIVDLWAILDMLCPILFGGSLLDLPRRRHEVLRQFTSPCDWLLLGVAVFLLLRTLLKRRKAPLRQIGTDRHVWTSGLLLFVALWLIVWADPVIPFNADRMYPPMTARDVQVILGTPDEVYGSQPGLVEATWTGMDGQIQVFFGAGQRAAGYGFPARAQSLLYTAQWTSFTREPLGKRLRRRWEKWPDQIECFAEELMNGGLLSTK
jgi:hypothetical protein